MDRRRFLTITAAALPCSSLPLASTAFSQAPSGEGDEFYRPEVGQAGKDVVWVPTPDALVPRCSTRQRSGDDLVFDLGCGDGKIPIAAARQFGAVAKGIEYEPTWHRSHAAMPIAPVCRQGQDHHRRHLRSARRSVQPRDRAHDVPAAASQSEAAPTILAMKPGTRVVTHAFHMGDWDPDEAFSVEGRDAF